jgi:hypothetical protein
MHYLSLEWWGNTPNMEVANPTILHITWELPELLRLEGRLLHPGRERKQVPGKSKC